MKQWPPNSRALIQYFGRLPGIGPKMAERIVLYLQKQSEKNAEEFAHTLSTLHSSVHTCQVCYTLSETKICSICSDSKRDDSLLLIVSDPVSAYNIEQPGSYNGKYFILGGLINPLEGITPDRLRFKELIQTINTNQSLKEIILGFNANVEGEATQLYIKKLLAKVHNIKITRLARGLPMGSEVSYADEVTLREALSGRQQV
jgi:recombination protein RecR